ncbi:MAG: homogentisate phytyltransferase [Microcoleaceae cyanobacterium]
MTKFSPSSNSSLSTSEPSQNLVQNASQNPSQSFPKHKIKGFFSWCYTLWKFSRPHTIIGTSLSVLGIFIIAFGNQFSAITSQTAFLGIWDNFLANSLTLGLAWLACICGNIYIVGLNQLEDIEIDRINKPNLPLASGAYSKQQAQIVVGVTGILALLIAAFQGGVLLLTVGVSLFIGTAYSLPPIRLKRFPFWAALCIFTVRGVIVNLGLFLHFQSKFSDGLSRFTENKFMIPLEVWILTGFILCFTVAIAIFKDIPDIEGDRQYNISTLTIRLGTETVFNIARWILVTCYLGTIFVTLLFRPDIQTLLLVATHLTALIWMFWKSTRVNLESKVEIARFYQFIWRLFFLEYIIFPIVCL